MATTSKQGTIEIQVHRRIVSPSGRVFAPGKVKIGRDELQRSRLSAHHYSEVGTGETGATPDTDREIKSPDRAK